MLYGVSVGVKSYADPVNDYWTRAFFDEWVDECVDWNFLAESCNIAAVQLYLLTHVQVCPYFALNMISILVGYLAYRS